MQLFCMQAILTNLEGDLDSEVRASGFEREHEVTLESWNAQNLASPEDRTELGATDSSSSASEGKQEDVFESADRSGQTSVDDTNCPAETQDCLEVQTSKGGCSSSKE